jgi:hypothetical protein
MTSGVTSDKFKDLWKLHYEQSITAQMVSISRRKKVINAQKVIHWPRIHLENELIILHDILWEKEILLGALLPESTNEDAPKIQTPPMS